MCFVFLLKKQKTHNKAFFVFLLKKQKTHNKALPSKNKRIVTFIKKQKQKKTKTQHNNDKFYNTKIILFTLLY